MLWRTHWGNQRRLTSPDPVPGSFCPSFHLTFLHYNYKINALDVLARKGVTVAPRLLDPEIEKSFLELPRGEREALSGAISGVARVLLGGSSEDIAALENKLRRNQENEQHSDSLEELEVRNKLRVFARYREIEERSLSGTELRERLGVSRQRLGQLRKEERLLGVRLPIRREVYYPLWQFGEDGRPLEAMPRLIEAAEEAGLGALALDALMTNPGAAESEAGGATLADLLRSGDPETDEYVLGVVRAALSGGA